jgi:hypothetical protein
MRAAHLIFAESEGSNNLAGARDERYDTRHYFTICAFSSYLPFGFRPGGSVAGVTKKEKKRFCRVLPVNRGLRCQVGQHRDATGEIGDHDVWQAGHRLAMKVLHQDGAGGGAGADIERRGVGHVSFTQKELNRVVT